ncbi:putative HVA22-like protein g [Tanacetum coccineum]
MTVLDIRIKVSDVPDVVVDSLRLAYEGLEALEYGSWHSAVDSDPWVALSVAERRLSARYKHEVVVVDDKLYIVGGSRSGRYLSGFQDSDQWVALSVAGRRLSTRYKHEVVVVDDKLYIVGGSRSGRYLFDFQDHVLLISMESGQYNMLFILCGILKPHNSTGHKWNICAGVVSQQARGHIRCAGYRIIGSFLTRGLIMVFGYAYPGNDCFKSVEKNKPDIKELRFWCQYWYYIRLNLFKFTGLDLKLYHDVFKILVAGLTVCERIGDTFLSWVPMNSEAKLAFYIYLWFPKTKDRGGKLEGGETGRNK